MQPPHVQGFTPVSNYLAAPILSVHVTCVDGEGNKSFAYRANILSSPAVHPNEILPDSLE